MRRPLPNMRIEKDFLGEKEVPKEAYWGVQTQRAIENFQISGTRPHPMFIVATAMVKKAAALANMECGVLEKIRGRAVAKAADEIISGKLHDQFRVDIYQAGAGTSHNMNANEVIANRANEILGGRKGDYSRVHPNDHVNYGQSTNDVFPTAMRIAALLLLEKFYPVLERAEKAFEAKAHAFRKIVKSGRTHLQDATPITLGQEFGGYAEALRRCERFIRLAAGMLLAVGLGGSAVGTGINTAKGYREKAVRHLRKISGLPVVPSENLFEAMQSMAPFSALSGALRVLALELGRIARDLRLLSSGPRTGFAEISLPELQPGSSIMPGKVNPVIAEMMEMVTFRVFGTDVAIGAAARAGDLELNVMMPFIAAALLETIALLKNALEAFTEKCARGIKANEARCRDFAEASVANATALSPILGYERTAQVVREALDSGKSVREVILGKKWMSPEKLDRALFGRGMRR